MMCPGLRRATRFAGVTLAVFVVDVASVAIVSCGAGPEAESAVYATELEECNRTAATLAESIACENRYRAAHGRPLRPMPADAGTGGDR